MSDKMTDLDFVLKSIGQGQKGRKKKDVEPKEFVTRIIDGQEFQVPVYGEIKARPKTYGKIRGKQTSDAQLVAKGDLQIEE